MGHVGSVARIYSSSPVEGKGIVIEPVPQTNSMVEEVVSPLPKESQSTDTRLRIKTIYGRIDRVIVTRVSYFIFICACGPCSSSSFLTLTILSEYFRMKKGKRP